MPKSVVREKVGSTSILKALSESTHGYKFGKPKRPDEKALTVLMPILREHSHDRGYVTFPETGENCPVFDTGTVQEIDVENKTGTHVFLRAGTLFKGTTQQRTAQRSLFLFKGAKNRINVRCVHATLGTGHAKMGYGGINTASFMKKSYNAGFTPKSQGEYWSNVIGETTKMKNMVEGTTGVNPTSQSHTIASGLDAEVDAPIASPATPESDALYSSILRRRPMYRSGAGGQSAGVHGIKADDLVSNMAAFEKNYEKVLSQVKMEDDQVGVVLITDDGVQMIETFDHHASWKALHESAVKSMGTEMLKEDKESVFEFKPEAALSMTQKVLAMEFEHSSIYHSPATDKTPAVSVSGITAKGYTGEVVEVDGEVIHLVIYKQE